MVLCGRTITNFVKGISELTFVAHVISGLFASILRKGCRNYQWKTSGRFDINLNRAC
jgi:hypothetical protein